MKATVAVAAFVGLVGRCSDADWTSSLDEPWDSDPAAPAELARDASVPPTAAEEDHEDAGALNADLCSGPPGLYADDACEHLVEGLMPYVPNYPLWSDGADKDRFIFLPDEAQIDTSNPDRWAFPVGTRIYKTFSRQGLKLETRVFEKVAQPAGIESWTFVSYAWSEDQRSVSLADAEGVQNVLGTDHDIPSQAQCRSCHNQPGLDIVNGFGAVQLNHAGRGWTLQRLLERDVLVNRSGDAANVDVEMAGLPGDETAQAALGYLHANCGHCHGGPSPRRGLDLSAVVGMTAVSDAPAYKVGAACTCLQRWTGRAADSGETFLFSVVPGSAVLSGIVGRMSVRGAGEQMPPLGTKHVDADGLGVVSGWLDGLAPVSCDPTLCITPAEPQ